VAGAPLTSTLLVDAANVVGSRPDGWWRDRAGAARKLVARLRASALERPVVVVLEGKAMAEGDVDGVRVVHAAREGDDTLVAIASDSDGPVRLVTADRELASRAREVGADVVGPGWLLDQL
jgi:hypothetical protein